MRIEKIFHILPAFVLLCGLFTIFAPAVFAEDQPVAVLLSREIAPYVAMVEGFEAELKQPGIERFFLDQKGQPYSLSSSVTGLDVQRYAALVAVGPEALSYLSVHKAETPLFYGMVLDPGGSTNSSAPAECGVTLELPIAAQLDAIKRFLPTARRIGVLFDPANNQPWFDQARLLAAGRNLELFPLRVESRSGRLNIVGDFIGPEALLFIPDKSIISRSIIQYVIKQAVLRRIAVIGYNRFFLDSGAALSFIIDYRGIGGQVAAQVRSTLNGQPCRGAEAPLFQVEVNPGIMRSLGLPADQEGR